MVASIPRASTRQHVQKQCGVTLGGPISDTKPAILSATDAKGRPLVVKLLKASPDSAGPELDQRQKELAFEAQIAKQFGSQASDKLAFLPTRVEEVKVEGRVSLYCLVMPRLVTTLAQLPQLPNHILLREGQRIRAALQRMHDQGLVHADVKGDNIFIDQQVRRCHALHSLCVRRGC